MHWDKGEHADTKCLPECTIANWEAAWTTSQGVLSDDTAGACQGQSSNPLEKSVEESFMEIKIGLIKQESLTLGKIIIMVMTSQNLGTKEKWARLCHAIDVKEVWEMQT